MGSSSNPPPGSRPRNLIGIAGLTVVLLFPVFFLSGCMTPEDRAFYGRGWLNPSELDQESPPPHNFQDPTAVQPHMMGPGYY
jgi:hypothetical protein